MTIHAFPVFSISSDEVLATGTKGRWIAPMDGKIVTVKAGSISAPTGSSIILDINKNGTTIFTTQANRPTIAAAATTATLAGAPEVLTFVAGDVFTVDVDQIGSGTAGTGFTVSVAYTGKDDADGVADVSYND